MVGNTVAERGRNVTHARNEQKKVLPPQPGGGSEETGASDSLQHGITFVHNESDVSNNYRVSNIYCYLTTYRFTSFYDVKSTPL